MTKPTLDELKVHIEDFDVDSCEDTARISEAYKIARNKTEQYAKTSKEAKLLTKFQKTLEKRLRQIRS